MSEDIINISEQKLSSETLEEKVSRIAEIAKINARLVYEKCKAVYGENPDLEICGLIDKDGVEFARIEYWSSHRTKDFISPEELRKMAQSGRFHFHTHGPGSSVEASAQDIFYACMSLGEVIYTQPQPGKKVIVIIVPKEIKPIGELQSLKTSLFYEAASIAEETGNFPQVVFNDLAREKLEFRELRIEIE